MFRRLPTYLSLTFAATVGLFALTSVLLAQPPATTPADKPADVVKPEDVKRSQEENAKFYRRFADEMLRLAQRWEKSDNPDERERAKALRAALDLAAKHGVDNLFKDLLSGLAKGNLNGTDFQDILGKDRKLIAALDEILRVLDTEDEQDQLRKQIDDIKKLIAEIERIKREQENVRARTENPRGDKNDIANKQNELAKQTDAIAKAFNKNNNANANGGGPKEDPKSEPKPEMKPGDANPEAKPDTPQNKADDKPTAGGMGDPKAAGGEPKPMGGGMPMDGGDKPAPKDGMGAGDPKAGGEPKPMGGMNPMDPKDQKPNAGDSKAQGDGKGDQKPSDGKPGGDAKPMTGQPMGGMPMAGGSPSQSKPSPGGGMPMGGGGMPPPGGQQPPKDNAQENVEQAVPPQKGAEEDIRGDKPMEASKKQDEAIKKLEQALQELEKRLKQLREKELAKLLANLEERVGRMLRMQIEVYEATKGIHATVVKNNNQKSNAEIQKSQAEADKERAIITEADRALKLMEGEGTAVVFAGVLAEVKNDMIAVQRRLDESRVEGRNKANEAEGTQLIEEQIIEQLTMMKEALKKAKQELENNQGKPPQDGNSGKPPNQKLLDLINELKLIKSLQEQVNKRTISYNKQDPGEQAKDTLIQAELKQLSERQKVLQDMLHKIATQANQ
jgi:hypothetical protein